MPALQRSDDPDRYLEKRGGKWKIRKLMDGIRRSFGPYDSIEEARSIRDQLFPAKETGPEFLERVVDEWREDPCESCIEWPFGKSKQGYGQVRIKGHGTLAHRVSWELSRSKTIPDGMLICHIPVICHNRACVNPSHLELGTYADNQEDRILDGTDHRGEKHPMAKLVEGDVLEIISMIKGGSRNVDIARRFGISPVIVSDIRRGAKWKHLAEK